MPRFWDIAHALACLVGRDRRATQLEPPERAIPESYLHIPLLEKTYGFTCIEHGLVWRDYGAIQLGRSHMNQHDRAHRYTKKIPESALVINLTLT
jgi:hypothetical protein